MTKNGKLATSQSDVGVIVTHKRVLVSPPCTAILAPVLTLPEFAPSVALDGQLLLQPRPKRLFNADHQLLDAAPGLAARIIRQLEANGSSVVVADQRRFGGQFLPNRALRHEVRREDRRVLKTVAREPRGQIVVYSEQDVLRVTELLHAYFPKTKTLLIVPGLQEAEMWQRRLQRSLPEYVELLHAARTPRARLCVTSHYRFNHGMGVQAGWGLFLYLGVAAATGAAVEKTTEYLMPARHYAIVTRQERRTRDDRLRLEFAAGPEIYRQGTAWGSAPTVSLSWATPPLVPIDTKRLDPLERKQHAIWSNEPRNRYIAALADAFVTADIGKLYKLGLLLDREADELRGYGGRMHVAVLVETVQHAVALKELLPDWEKTTALSHATVPGESICATWEMPQVERGIVTMARADRYGIDADVIIRADGTNTPWQDAWGPHPVHDGDGKRLFVIDLRDDFDELAGHHAEDRRQRYGELGWTDSAVEHPSLMISAQHAQQHRPARRKKKSRLST